MHQSSTPSLSQTIWPFGASRQFPTLPIVQTLLPVTFGYSLSSEAVVMRQFEEMKEAVTKVIDTFTHEDFHGAFQKLLGRTASALQPKEITSKGTRVSCVYYQWKCPYEKRLETYLMILVFITKHDNLEPCICNSPITCEINLNRN